MSKRGPSSPRMRSPASPTNDDAKVLDEFVMVPTRQEKRKQRKVDKQKPAFQFDTTFFRAGKGVGIAHVRDLVLYIVADGQKPSWIVPEYKSAIAHTVVLYVPGILPEHLGLGPISVATTMPFAITTTEEAIPNKLPVMKTLFTYACPTRAPGDQRRLHSATHVLLSSPLPDNIRKQKEEKNRRATAAAKTAGFSPLIYLLTPNEMLDNDYRLPTYIPASDDRIIPGLDLKTLPPLVAASLAGPSGALDGTIVERVVSMGNGVGKGKGKAKDEGWVETPEAKTSPTDAEYPILAIDCEMVLTDDGQELARVSVIDFTTGKNIYDRLVKPPKPVTDYRTQWSGITAEKLAGASHALADVQKDLVTGPKPLITSHTILLGHSLECDLTALKIRHPLCIDTALLYKHPRGPPYKPGLKWLAQRWMNKEIQSSQHGHDSEEDAGTCVELLRLKMQYGPEFGGSVDTTEPIFERISRWREPNTKSPKSTAMHDYGNPAAGHGAKANTVQRCTTDDEVIDGMIASAQNHDLVFGRLTELHNAAGWNTNNKADALPADRSSNGDHSHNPDQAINSALESLNERIRKLHASLPGNTAFIMMNGHSNPLPMMQLMAKRQKWERLIKTIGGFEDIPKEERWLSEHDRLLEEKVAEARCGMAFFCVKRS